MIDEGDVLVRWYQAVQRRRVGLAQAMRAAQLPPDARAIAEQLATAHSEAERALRALLVERAATSAVAERLRSVPGFGPQSAAVVALLAAPARPYRTVGQCWRRCGLDPTAATTVWRRVRKQAVLVVVGALLRARRHRSVQEANAPLFARYDRAREAALARGWTAARAQLHARRVLAKWLLVGAVALALGPERPPHVEALWDAIDRWPEGGAT
ncbi:MAG: hypothetical protein NZ761_06235 [Dehalococcoidia bacterium]|nr:hypothetical protein [Dehalococcoidia bacterium]